MTPIEQAIEALPPLPEPTMEDVPGELWGQNFTHTALFTAEQMRKYALSALRGVEQPVGEPDVADIIAGALPTSRAHAYELMREALRGVEQQPGVCHKRANDYCKCSRNAMLCDGTGPATTPQAPVLLTEAEIDELPLPKEPDYDDKIKFARAIESEVLRRVGGGV